MSKEEKRACYYSAVFRFEGSREKHVWNWPAFFLANIWGLYRKMYLYTFAAGVISFVALAIINKVFQSGGYLIYGILSLIYMIFWGYFGNSLYYRHVKKKISAGYHLMKKYKCTSASLAVLSFFASGVPAVALIWIIFLPGACLADYLKKNSDLAKLTDSEKDFDINEKNIRRYLNYDRENHTPGKVITVLANIVNCVFTLLVAFGLVLAVFNDDAKAKFKEQFDSKMKERITMGQANNNSNDNAEKISDEELKKQVEDVLGERIANQ